MGGDTTFRVWQQAFGSSASNLAEAVIPALRAHGIVADGTPGEPIPRLIFFSDPDPDLVPLVHEFSGGGRRLTLAITEGETLPDDLAWRLLEAGAADVFLWQTASASQIAVRIARWMALEDLVVSPTVREVLIGASTIWSSLLRRVAEIAHFTDASVLFLGPSGTGKELLARMVHDLDGRTNKGELVVLDCTTIVPDLSGSEFYGHERGAFTGAVSARDGAFARAHGGTLFLDEVGELPLPLQAQLLRVVQEGKYKRVGGNEWRQTSFRLVCATNRDLDREVRKGRFRADLYYRIASWVCQVPALEERREDIIPLARHFLRHSCAGRPVPDLDPLVLRFLLARSYPGNVRELKQLVQRLAQRHLGIGPVTVGCVPEDVRPQPGSAPCVWPDPALAACIHHALALGVGLKEISATAADLAISIALAEEGSNVQRAAQRLGVTDRAIQMRLAAARGRQAQGQRWQQH